MNPALFRHPLRRSALALALGTLFLSGCWVDRVVWSPDGARATVITKEGLHLCDADGTLSPLLVPGAYRAAWLADSQRLVVARTRKVSDYGALAAALGPDRTRALAAKAEALWQRFADNPKVELSGPLEPADDLGAIFLYLRTHHHEAVRAKLDEKERADFDATTVDWHTLVVARIAGDRLEFAAPIAEGLATFRSLRPTPSGSAVAFVTPIELSPDNDASLQLFVAPLDGSAPPAMLAAPVAAHPDWTPDSRTIVYLQAVGGRTPGKPDELCLGTLVEHGVLDAAGHVRLDAAPRELAGLIFQIENRVRCLRDGRVLFDAGEFHLPLAEGGAKPREQLFSLDRTAEKPAVIPMIPRDELGRLPNPLAFFEVSPDESAVLFGGGGDIPVLHLADGRVEHFAVPLVDGQDHNAPLPVWRRPGEFTYMRAGKPRNELVLRHGESETVLSRPWPDEVLQHLIE